MSKDCYDCKKRHPGCHGSCESYQLFQEELKAKREAERKAKQSERVWDQYALDRERTVNTRLNRKSHVFKGKRK